VTAKLRALPADRLHLWLMLLLTFTTGINDAVGYLGLDKVFTGNMTGNVVILGMALVGADDLPVLGPALALVGFMLGAAVGGRVLRRTSRAWSTGTTVLLASVAVVMCALAVLLFVVPEVSHVVMVSTTTLASVAMGAQAAAARVVGVKDVTTVVVTSTITGLASDSRLGAGKPGSQGKRFWAVVLILLGAAAGAALLHVHVGAGLLLAGVLIAGATVVGALHATGEQR